MNVGDEKKALEFLRDALQKQDAAQKRWHAALLYGLGGIGIFAGYSAAVSEWLDVRLAIAITGLGGSMIGVASFYSTCQKQSRFLLQHLSLESIQRRLRELDT